MSEAEPSQRQQSIQIVTNDLRGRRTKTMPGDQPPAPKKLSLKRAATTLFTPEKKLKKDPNVLQSLKAILFASWLNVLLLCIPISWAFHFVLKDKSTLTFVFSFLSRIALAKLFDFATEELSLRVGQTLARLLHVTLGNTVELIIAIVALGKCELSITQSSLVGSILSNILLGLGMCFFAGGIKFQEQAFGHMATKLNTSLMTISVIPVLLPMAFRFAVGNLAASIDLDKLEGSEILSLSRIAAVILLLIIVSYFVFQLYTHTILDADEGGDAPKSTQYAPGDMKKRKEKVSDLESRSECSDDKESEGPSISLTVTVVLLVVVTAMVVFTAMCLVDSIGGMTDSGGISKEFVSIILLPIAGNIEEFIIAATGSAKDKLSQSLGILVGTSIHIALFVIPFIIILGWILGRPLTLLFDPYESTVLFLAVLTVNCTTQDDRSNWLEGLVLMSLYLILVLQFWYYPGIQDQTLGGLLPQCHH